MTRQRPVPDARAVPITVVSGLDRLSVDDLVTGVLLRNDRVVSVHPDPSTAGSGYVTVTTKDGTGRTETYRVELERGCVSCTLRRATVAALDRLAGRGEHDAITLQLHPGIEADAALRGLLPELSPRARVDTHLAVLPPTWLDTLSGAETLRDHDAAITEDDDRFAATVLCAAVETATTIVLPVDRATTSDDQRAVLDLLAPAAVRVRLQSVLDVPDGDILVTGRFDAARLDPLAEYGIRDPHRSLTSAGSLTLVRWRGARPLHPLRLHAALDQLSTGVIRSSGRLDVADQPDAVVGWDSAGESLLLGPIAPSRRHPTHRRSALAFLGENLDAGHLHAVLDACLVTDDELAVLTSAWDEFGTDVSGWPPDPTAHEHSEEPGPARHGGSSA